MQPWMTQKFQRTVGELMSDCKSCCRSVDPVRPKAPEKWGKEWLQEALYRTLLYSGDCSSLRATQPDLKDWFEMYEPKRAKDREALKQKALAKLSKEDKEILGL